MKYFLFFAASSCTDSLSALTPFKVYWVYLTLSISIILYLILLYICIYLIYLFIYLLTRLPLNCFTTFVLSDCLSLFVFLSVCCLFFALLHALYSLTVSPSPPCIINIKYI